MRSALPKVLQPLAGRPLLDHVLTVFRDVGASDIAVVYGHGGDAVKAACDGPDIRWVLQAEQLGTGHAALQGAPDVPDDNRLVCTFGDMPLLRASTLRSLIDQVGDDELGVLTGHLDDPFGMGRIVRDDSGNVIASVEEKDANDAQRAIQEINSGVIIGPGKRFKAWLNALTNDNAQNEYYLTDLIGMAVNDGVTVRGIMTDDAVEVMGINDKKQLAEAERALQARRVDELLAQGVGFADPARVDIRGELRCGTDVYIDVNAVFEGNVTLGDRVHIGPNNLVRDSHLGDDTVLHSNCHVEGAHTGDACEIGPYARLRPGAELANNVKVGNFVEIKKSTVADGSKVNHLTYIGDAKIGTDVNVGAGTITCNYDGANKHQTVIGDGVFVGSGVNLVAPVEVGAGATVGAGSTITKPVEADQLVLERSKQKSVPGWKRPTKKT